MLLRYACRMTPSMRKSQTSVHRPSAAPHRRIRPRTAASSSDTRCYQIPFLLRGDDSHIPAADTGLVSHAYSPRTRRATHSREAHCEHSREEESEEVRGKLDGSASAQHHRAGAAGPRTSTSLFEGSSHVLILFALAFVPPLVSDTRSSRSHTRISHRTPSWQLHAHVGSKPLRS